MPLASNLTPESRFMALFIGKKHSGKSAAAASFYSKEGKKLVKFNDADGRIGGLQGCPWLDLRRIDYDYFPPKMAGGTKNFFERVNEQLEAMLVEVRNNTCIHETYVADSLTAVCKNFIMDAIPLSHQENKGKKMGTLNIAGPGDYGFESTAMDAYLSFLRSLPLNIIATAHIIDRYGKKDPDDAYSESVVVGEKLSLRDKIAESSSIYFNHIFRFERKMVGGKERFFVTFIDNLACTSFSGLPTGPQDITGLNFKDYLLSMVEKGKVGGK